MSDSKVTKEVCMMVRSQEDTLMKDPDGDGVVTLNNSTVLAVIRETSHTGDKTLHGVDSLRIIKFDIGSGVFQ